MLDNFARLARTRSSGSSSIPKRFWMKTASCTMLKESNIFDSSKSTSRSSCPSYPISVLIYRREFLTRSPCSGFSFQSSKSATPVSGGRISSLPALGAVRLTFFVTQATCQDATPVEHFPTCPSKYAGRERFGHHELNTPACRNKARPTRFQPRCS